MPPYVCLLHDFQEVFRELFHLPILALQLVLVDANVHAELREIRVLERWVEDNGTSINRGKSLAVRSFPGLYQRPTGESLLHFP